MTTKVEIKDNNMKSRYSCEVKNSLIFHITEIIVILIHLKKCALSCRTNEINLGPVLGKFLHCPGPPWVKSVKCSHSSVHWGGGPGQWSIWYYNAKGLRNSSVEKAIQAFKELLTKEQHNPTLLSFKALKQLVKLHIRHAHKEQYIRDYQRLLQLWRKER